MATDRSDSNANAHAKNLRKGRFSEEAGLYLVTKCTAAKQELNELQRMDVVDALRLTQQDETVLLHAFVVMPDHWHALLSLGGDRTLGQAVWQIARRASYPSRGRGGSLSWQREYHDHKVRPMESVVDIVRYVEENPVRKGLAASSASWVWSSAYPGNADMLDRAFLGHERWA